MPHFGLMDENKLPPEQAALLRARLHIRAGKRRLLEGKEVDGLATLYDALSNGLRYYAMNHAQDLESTEDDSKFHQQELAIARKLVELGVLDDLDFITRFCSLIDQALDGLVPEINPQELLENLDKTMTSLGVMPFSENKLPPEAPGSL